MSKRIGIVGVSSILDDKMEAETLRIARELYPQDTPYLEFAPRHAPSGHFCGTDDERAADFVNFANREDLDAVSSGADGQPWFRLNGHRNDKKSSVISIWLRFKRLG